MSTDTIGLQSKKRRFSWLHIVEGTLLLVLSLLVFRPIFASQIGRITRSQTKKISLRDEQRIHDAKLIQSAIVQYRIRKGFYPASTLVFPFTDKSTSSEKIWISDNINLSDLPFDSVAGKYLTYLPRDPLNRNEYVYQYKSSEPPADKYEFNVRLEEDPSGLMKSDGGDNDNWLEFGNDLELLN